MIKQALIATSFLLGGAGTFLVVHLAGNPLAFTAPVAQSPLHAPASPNASVAAPSAVESEVSLVVREVTIVASLERASTSTAPADALDPCSRWDEVGALYIEPSGATGVRSVRRLCRTAR